MNYIAVRGHGDPNQEDGEYKQAIGLVYGIAFTIKMSKKGDHQIEGYYDYVVPPLEGFWWQDGISGVDYVHKEDFNWISVIRLPDFVTRVDFDWAVAEATKKKKQDFSKVEFLTYDEGLSVQCMHQGSHTAIHRIDGLLFEEDQDVHILEFSDILQAVQRVTGKPADRLGDLSFSLLNPFGRRRA